jgi:hypothetical protein
MAKMRTFRTFRIWVAALYALSMAMLGFAHAMPARLSSAAGADLAAYVLPDGSVPSLCISGENPGKQMAAGQVCDACLLTASPGLPISSVGEPPLPLAPATPARLVAVDRGCTGTSTGLVPHLRGPPSPAFTA